MKELYVTITGSKHYYGQAPFKVGRKIKCVKEPDNPYDAEAIRATMKHIGTVGYLANSPYTTAVGTKSAGAIGHKVKKKFTVEVMFIAGAHIICRVVDGRKEKKQKVVPSIDDADLGYDDQEMMGKDGGKEWDVIHF